MTHIPKTNGSLYALSLMCKYRKCSTCPLEQQCLQLRQQIDTPKYKTFPYQWSTKDIKHMVTTIHE